MGFSFLYFVVDAGYKNKYIDILVKSPSRLGQEARIVTHYFSPNRADTAEMLVQMKEFNENQDNLKKQREEEELNMQEKNRIEEEKEKKFLDELKKDFDKE